MSKELQDHVFTEIQKDQIIKELQDEYNIEPLLTIDEYHLKEQIEKNVYWQESFRLLALKERGNLTRLEIMRDELQGNRYDELKNRGQTSLTKAEIVNYYLPRDPELIKLKKLMLKVETRLEYFEAVRDAFKQQSYQFKTYIESMK